VGIEVYDIRDRNRYAHGRSNLILRISRVCDFVVARRDIASGTLIGKRLKEAIRVGGRCKSLSFL